MAVERIIELVTHRTLYPEIQTQLHFIKENCYRLMNCLTSLEASNTPLACSVFNTLEDLRSYLLAGVSKTRFGEETDRYLSRLGQSEKRKMIKSFQSVFKKSSDKLNGHLDRHPAYSFYRVVRVFDPRQLPCLSHDIANYEDEIKALKEPSQELMDEWLIYTQFQPDALPSALELPSFWASMVGRFPLLSQIALNAIWMPVTSVDVERSFSQYKYLLNERRESLTQDNTKRLMLLYFNGDIEHRFNN